MPTLERCSTRFAIRETNVQNDNGPHYIPVRTVEEKTVDHTKLVRTRRKLELSHIADGTNGTATMGDSSTVP